MGVVPVHYQADEAETKARRDHDKEGARRVEHGWLCQLSDSAHCSPEKRGHVSSLRAIIANPV